MKYTKETFKEALEYLTLQTPKNPENKYMIGRFEMAKDVKNLILCDVSRSNAIDYKEGFELAMDFIDKHPADPDITSEQLNAWIKLQDFVNKHKE